MSTTVDYKNDEAETVDAECSECGEQLNETELQESKEYVEGDKKFCTTHLHELLGIPV
jgi:transcription initiation factor IIE alpha subunit